MVGELTATVERMIDLVDQYRFSLDWNVSDFLFRFLVVRGELKFQNCLYYDSENNAVAFYERQKDMPSAARELMRELYADPDLAWYVNSCIDDAVGDEVDELDQLIKEWRAFADSAKMKRRGQS